MTVWKKLTSVFMSAVLVVGLCPGLAFAQGGNVQVAGANVTTQEENAPEAVELEITNNTGMFKAVSASAVAGANDSATLTFALSGTGYHWLYMGTYEEALAANDAIAKGISENTGSDKLIKGATNSEGKWEFQMTIPADQLGKEVPVVAISQSYYEKYAKGDNALERSYYPRQFNLNLADKTLVTGDYDMTYDFALTSDVADFKATTPMSVRIVGGPNSNNYKVEPTFGMENDVYDKVTFPCVVPGKVATSSVELVDGKFAVSMSNAPNQIAFKDKTPLTFTFHVAKDAPYVEADTDVERTVTFDQIARTVTVAGAALTEKPATEFAYEGDAVNFIGKNGNGFGMFAPQEGTVAAVEGDNVVITYLPKNKTIYAGFYLCGDIAISSTWDSSKYFEAKDGSYSITLPKSYCGYAWPVAVVKANKTTTKEQYYLAIPTEVALLPSADYSAVNTAKERAKAVDTSKYTPASVAALNGALAAVVEGKKTNEQAAVDAMAKAIEDAISALVARIDLSQAAVALSWTKSAYNGSVQKPSVTTVRGKTLQAGVDCEVSYSDANSTNVGSYTVTVTGKGNYSGVAQVASYEIVRADQKVAATVKAASKKKAAKVKAGKSVVGAKIANLHGKVTVKNKTKKGAAKKFKVSYKAGKIKIAVPKKTKKGTYKVIFAVNATGDANYAASGAKKVTCWVKVK